MKFLRLKISTDFLKVLNFDYLFDYYDEIELLDFFHYDKNNFFTLERVVLKREYEPKWREIIEKTHKVKYFNLIEKKDCEITAIMNISRRAGFFPIVGSELWAIIPPTTLDSERIYINILADPEVLPKLYEVVGDSSHSFDILAINDFKKSFNQDDKLLFPKFTDRQKTITRYAVRNGYFNSPKGITAQSIADHFEISVSAVNEHLRKARKIALEYFFS